MEPQEPTKTPTVFAPLRADELPSFVAGKNVVHFKGFGPSLDTKTNLPPLGMLDHLSQCDVLVFDGDDFTNESFTHVFHSLYLHTRDHSKRGFPTLLAFKLADEAQQLIGPTSSWQAFPHPITLNYCLVDRGECQSSRLLHAVTASVTPSQRMYVGLGVWALERVRACSPSSLQVCVWGGYHVVVSEFLCHVDLCGAEGGVPWHYWHASRVKDGKTQEGLLKDITHPILQHHLQPGAQ